MSPIENGEFLHQRWTLGESLNAKEQAILETWYAEQDVSEAETLRMEMPKEWTIEQLKTQVNQSIRQISEMLERIQHYTAENDRLKQENEQLKKLLAQQTSRQRA